MPDIDVAELTINGQVYRDWTSVSVVRRFGDNGAGVSEFEFTCTEGSPQAKTFAAMRIVPGDRCDIKLSGVKALAGWVNVRQAAYNANQHGVIIGGRGLTQDIHDSSIPLDKIGGGQFKNSDFKQIANRVLPLFGISLTMIGSPGPKFRDVQYSPGESAWNFIERLGRVAGVRIGDDDSGNLVAISDKASPASGGKLVEGDNILIGRCTISDYDRMNSVTGLGSINGTNDRHGVDASEISATATGGLFDRLRHMVFVAEKPVLPAELTKRVDQEASWRETASIIAQITVRGWLKPGGGGLWKAGEMVQVSSPSLLLDQELLAQAVAFTQDNDSGTRTTLELVRYGGKPNLSGANPPASTMGPAKIDPPVQE